MAAEKSEKADLVLHEGAILEHPASDSVALGGGRILAHGRFAELKPLVGPRTHLLRLDGRVVAPGFIDCHLHFLEGASVAAGLSVLRCRAIPDLLADLRVAAGRTPPGNWLKAFGCDESLMREGRGPSREELDQATPKNPLRLRHQTLHASWLNSRAITLLGLERPDFQPPEGAALTRESGGRLGALVTGMEEWLGARMPRVTEAELEARARVFSRELAAAGVTAFTDATARNGVDDFALFGRLTANGAIVQRVAVMAGPDCIDQVAALRRISEVGAVGLAGIKFIAPARWAPARLARAIADALAQELDCAFHCTEVEELDAALSAIAMAREQIGSRLLRRGVCRIEHGGLIPPYYPERIAALGVWVVTNPGFIHYRGAKYAREPGLIPYLYRAKSLTDLGVELAAGTDAPVTPARPLAAVAVAVSRLSLEGYELAPDERLDAASAIALFTSAAARLSRLEAGTIEAGRLADLIVLSSDPLSAPPAELLKATIDLTIIDGRVVYERGRPATTSAAGANLP
ncbi:MAG TPA: amidohydrolase family protein [Candidatus Binataceae bacterium]|nr:amidohydrolase family protein [Candidatus Binataceae bacterium]